MAITWVASENVKPEYSFAPRERLLPELLPRDSALVPFEPAVYGPGDWWSLPSGRLAVCVGDVLHVFEALADDGGEGGKP